MTTDAPTRLGCSVRMRQVGAAVVFILMKKGRECIMDQTDFIRLMSDIWERHLLRLLVDEGTLTAEEYAGILRIAQTQRKLCCNP